MRAQFLYLWTVCAVSLSPVAGPDPGVSAASLSLPPVSLGAPASPSYFRDPSEALMREFTQQLNGALIARIPTSFGLREGHVDESLEKDAILFGDVDGDGQREYIVGCYFPLYGTRAELKDDRARIVVFKRQGRRWIRSWTSPGLGHEFARPRYNIDEVEIGLDVPEHLQPPLQLVRMAGDRLAIVYFAWSQSTALGALPGIYVWQENRWRNVAPQADRFSIRDLNGDGNLEVVAGSRYIGYGSGDDDVPRVFRWDGDRFTDASQHYPNYYEWLVERYRSRLQFLEKTRQTFTRDVWERAIQKAESFAISLPTTSAPIR